MSLYSQTNYPKIAAHIGIVHPIVTFSKDQITTNFSHYYTVGFPTGINLWKTPKIGFPFEVMHFIRSEKGSSKMNNFLFHPGVLVTLGKGYTFAEGLLLKRPAGMA